MENSVLKKLKDLKDKAKTDKVRDALQKKIDALKSGKGILK